MNNLLSMKSTVALIRAAIDREEISERELVRRTDCNVAYLHYSAITGDKPMSQRLINTVAKALKMSVKESLLLKMLAAVEASDMKPDEQLVACRLISKSFETK